MKVVSIGGGDPLRAPTLLRELETRYLVWDAFVAGQRRVDLHPIVLPRALHERAVHVAESVMRDVSKVASRAHADPNERALYRLPKSAERLAEASHFARDDASLVRVDLLFGEDGDFHVCEINADCPGGHNEALGLPKLARAAGFSHGHDPTRVVPALARRLADLARLQGERAAVGMIYATAYAEDLQVCAIMRRELQKLGVPAVLAPPTAPILDASGALTIRGVQIGALYRYFPAEYMEGQGNVGAIAQAIAAGRVRTLSSFAHVYTQSKLSLARAGLLPNVPETRDLLEISEDELRRDRAEWVVKRSYSRVGEDVVVGALQSQQDWDLALSAILAERRAGESWIAQRFVRQQAMPTPWGPRFLTLGAYLLDGNFVGYFARVTPASHVSHDALVLPTFVEAA
jgi:glutathionylspermidine synthase